MITIKIPVKKCVKNYLLQQYGDSFKISRMDHVGILLWLLMKKNLHDKAYEGMMKQYTDTYEANASENMIYKKGVRYLSDFAIVQFNVFIENIIHGELHKHMENEKERGGVQADAIRSFIKKYDLLETELDFQNLKKSWQRYCNKKKNINKHAPTLSPCETL